VDAIRANRAPKVDGREGRKAVDLICAIYESARTGRTVPLS
jgi:predicted dehydrogenase